MRWDELAAQYPVILLEGCDGTGKTTIARHLARQHGYTVVRADRAASMCQYQEVLGQPGTLALDRGFPSELVYGPLRTGTCRLSPREAAELAFAFADRGGVLVHLTAHPKALAWRLRARDGYSPALDWIRSVLRSYRDVFAALDGAAPIVKVDTTAEVIRTLPDCGHRGGRGQPGGITGDGTISRSTQGTPRPAHGDRLTAWAGNGQARIR